MKEAIEIIVQLPDGVTAAVSGRSVAVKGPMGSAQRSMGTPAVRPIIKDQAVVISVPKSTRREKRLANSMEAHLRNMIAGVRQPFVYKLKICNSHFPMNVSLSGNQLVVKNFLGEKTPRTIRFNPAAKVKVAGDVIEIESCDIEIAGTTASKFEGLTFISKRDRRIFQDGIYITSKPGVKA
jgi:large subunit ribosomal protein L6